MAFAVTNIFTGASVLNSAHIDENFDDIADVINGGLTSENLSASAGIVNAQLANDDFVFTVNLTCNGTIWNTGTGGVAFSGLPDTSGAVYTVIGYSWTCTDVGAEDGTFAVQWGSFSGASNVWASTTTIIANTTLASSDTGADTCGSATGALSIDVTPATSGKPRVFSLRNVATGTNVMSSALDMFSVTLLVKRKNGLGSY